MKIQVESCDKCDLSQHSPGDGLWFCGHPTYSQNGTFVDVTRPDGTPFKRGVSRRCPLRNGDVTFVLAKGVKFL